MRIDEGVMDGQERIGFGLRSLYQQRGYSRYRMSRFEEYDLYSRNKDFLLSGEVMTFTDTDGRLMALRPDVTLSIVRNGRDCGPDIQKLYYHENVYRATDPENGFREQAQVGIECIGGIDGKCVSEVLELAAESLERISPEWMLEVGQTDLLSAALSRLAGGEALRKELLLCAGRKNLHGIREACRASGLPEGAEENLMGLMSLSGPPEKTLAGVREIADRLGCPEAAEDLERALSAFRGRAAESRLWIDFSGAGNLKYYNGITFRGFLRGIPDSVLSGGQYDGLMRRMGRKDRAVGFAVYLHRLERLTEGGKGDA